MSTLYVAPGVLGGEGVYSLVTEEGEVLYQHFCSSAGFAPGDLIERRPERKTECGARFGEYEVKFIDEPGGLTSDELLARNKKWMEEHVTADFDYEWGWASLVPDTEITHWLDNVPPLPEGK